MEMTTTVSYTRTFVLPFDAAKAYELRKAGYKLRQIKYALGTDASISSIYRAVKKMERLET